MQKRGKNSAMLHMIRKSQKVGCITWTTSQYRALSEYRLRLWPRVPPEAMVSMAAGVTGLVGALNRTVLVASTTVRLPPLALETLALHSGVPLLEVPVVYTAFAGTGWPPTAGR